MILTFIRETELKMDKASSSVSKKALIQGWSPRR